MSAVSSHTWRAGSAETAGKAWGTPRAAAFKHMRCICFYCWMPSIGLTSELSADRVQMDNTDCLQSNLIQIIIQLNKDNPFKTCEIKYIQTPDCLYFHSWCRSMGKLHGNQNKFHHWKYITFGGSCFLNKGSQLDLIGLIWQKCAILPQNQKKNKYFL